MTEENARVWISFPMTEASRILINVQDMDPQHRLMLEVVYEALESGM